MRNSIAMLVLIAALLSLSSCTNPNEIDKPDVIIYEVYNKQSFSFMGNFVILTSIWNRDWGKAVDIDYTLEIFNSLGVKCTHTLDPFDEFAWKDSADVIYGVPVRLDGGEAAYCGFSGNSPVFVPYSFTLTIHYKDQYGNQMPSNSTTRNFDVE